jgi:hypothetical protein
MINCYFDFLRPCQFPIEPEPRLGRSKKRDEEFKVIWKHGQTRRVVISPYGDVLPSDIPLFEALIAAGYSSIAVVVFVACTKPWDIKATKAFSANYPLRWFGGRKAQRARRKMREAAER